MGSRFGGNDEVEFAMTLEMGTASPQPRRHSREGGNLARTSQQASRPEIHPPDLSARENPVQPNGWRLAG